jgi:uncharacterized protein (DUF736 family)
MAHIGQFTRTRTGYVGRLKTLSVEVDLSLIATEPSEAENAPDYRVVIGHDDQSLDIGAGWKRTGEKAGDYVSVLLDDPMLPRPINANLFRSLSDQTLFLLVWNRPAKRRDGG